MPARVRPTARTARRAPSRHAENPRNPVATPFNLVAASTEASGGIISGFITHYPPILISDPVVTRRVHRRLHYFWIYTLSSHPDFRSCAATEFLYTKAAARAHRAARTHARAQQRIRDRPLETGVNACNTAQPQNRELQFSRRAAAGRASPRPRHRGSSLRGMRKAMDASGIWKQRSVRRRGRALATVCDWLIYLLCKQRLKRHKD